MKLNLKGDNGAKEAPKIAEDEQDKEIKEEQPQLNEIYVCSRCHMKKIG